MIAPGWRPRRRNPDPRHSQRRWGQALARAPRSLLVNAIAVQIDVTVGINKQLPARWVGRGTVQRVLRAITIGIDEVRVDDGCTAGRVEDRGAQECDRDVPSGTALYVITPPVHTFTSRTRALPNIS